MTETTAVYHDIPRDLLAVIEPVALAHGLEIVDAAVGKGPGRSRVELTLDTPAGDGRVTVDECAAVSREVGHALDATDVIHGSYLLEVTSPGVDRRLGREVDFERCVGRRVSVETHDPRDGRRRFKGELISFDGISARVDTDAGPFDIPFATIRRANAFHPTEPAASARGSKR